MNNTKTDQSGSLERVDMRHGVDCEKAPHNEKGGYLHAEGDNSPYEVDGLLYCGRCHHWLRRVSHIS